MKDGAQFNLVDGFDALDAQRVAELYWEAFSEKFIRIFGDERRALSIISKRLNPDFCVCAYAKDGALVGVAGFKTEDGALLDVSYASLAAVYGYLGASWRAALLYLMGRTASEEGLLMDGIFVDAAQRGQGAGALLLRALERRAVQRGKKYIRLDVIDKNAAAKRLYERVGFQVVATRNIGPLSLVFRFQTVDEMRKQVVATAVAE